MAERGTRVSRHVRRAQRAVARPPQPWPPAPGLSDSRLAYFAARPALRVLSQTRLGALLSILERGSFNTTRGGAYVGLAANDMAAEGRGIAMRSLVVACEDAVERLTAAERAALRATGTLPEWFVPTVAAEAADIRRLWHGR